jgi:hypothetical protein
MPQQLASLGPYHPQCPDLHRLASFVCTISTKIKPINGQKASHNRSPSTLSIR